MSIKVEKNGEKGAKIVSDSTVELSNIDEIRTVIIRLESILEEIVTSNRRKK
jgi:hypothetical protein